MKNKFVVALLGTVVNALAMAQQPQPQQPTTASATQQSLSASLGLHAFPAKDQTAQQRQADESACYNWARQDTGFDPIAASSNAAASASSNGTPKGLGVGGAAMGAGGGAAIGAIAGDAGKGAAIGAATGGMRGPWQKGALKRKPSNRLK